MSTIMDPEELRRRVTVASEYEAYRSDSKDKVRAAIAGFFDFPGSEEYLVASQADVLPAPADPIYAEFANMSPSWRSNARQHVKHYSTSVVPIATRSGLPSPPSSPMSTGSVFQFPSIRTGECFSLTSFSSARIADPSTLSLWATLDLRLTNTFWSPFSKADSHLARAPRS